MSVSSDYQELEFTSVEEMLPAIDSFFNDDHVIDAVESIAVSVFETGPGSDAQEIEDIKHDFFPLQNMQLPEKDFDLLYLIARQMNILSSNESLDQATLQMLDSSEISHQLLNTFRELHQQYELLKPAQKVQRAFERLDLSTPSNASIAVQNITLRVYYSDKANRDHDKEVHFSATFEKKLR